MLWMEWVFFIKKELGTSYRKAVSICWLSQNPKKGECRALRYTFPFMFSWDSSFGKKNQKKQKKNFLITAPPGRVGALIFSSELQNTDKVMEFWKIGDWGLNHKVIHRVNKWTISHATGKQRGERPYKYSDRGITCISFAVHLRNLS